MSEITVIIIVVSVLLIILTLLLTLIIKRVNLLMKNAFVQKISEFDFLIEDKEQELDKLNNSIAEKQDEIKELESKIEEAKNFNPSTKGASDVVLPKYADFEDGNLLYGYKKIKKSFNFNTTKILADFINKNVDNSKEDYLVYSRIRGYFSYDVVYKLSTYQSNEQKLIVTELLSDEEKNKVNKILSKRKFDIKSFVDSLDNYIVKTNPEIRVFVGDVNLNYDNLNPDIKTIYDEKITEGFKILYKGVVYDYSI